MVLNCFFPSSCKGDHDFFPSLHVKSAHIFSTKSNLFCLYWLNCCDFTGRFALPAGQRFLLMALCSTAIDTCQRQGDHNCSNQKLAICHGACLSFRRRGWLLRQLLPLQPLPLLVCKHEPVCAGILIEPNLSLSEIFITAISSFSFLRPRHKCVRPSSKVDFVLTTFFWAAPLAFPGKKGLFPTFSAFCWADLVSTLGTQAHPTVATGAAARTFFLKIQCNCCRHAI